MNNLNSRNVEYSSSVQTQTRPQEDDIHQSAEGGVKERVHKKRKEKPSDKEGTSKDNKIMFLTPLSPRSKCKFSFLVLKHFL